MSSDSDPQAGTSTADATTAPAVDDGAGQGTGTGTEGLYQGLLSSVPEELHPQLQEGLKKLDGDVNKKFQEHAEFRKQFESLAGIDGLSDVPAEDLGGLVTLYGLVNQAQAVLDAEERGTAPPDGAEEAFNQVANWWEQVGQDLGLLDADGADGGAADGEPDTGTGDESDLVSELRERIDQLENGWKQREAQSEQQQRVEKHRQEFSARLSEVVQQHQLLGDDGEPDPDAITAITDFASKHLEDPDPIGKGLERYLKLTGKAQSQLVTDRLAQPAAANGDGTPDTTSGPPKSFKDARAAAMQRLPAGAT